MKYSWTGPSKATDHAEDEFLRQELTKPNDTNRFHSSPTKRGKRFRSAFTTDQINYLEKQFKKFPYIGNGHRKEVAVALDIPERAVKIWFQNRRMKEKKDAIGKEFDEQQNGCKTEEFPKNQLNNVSSLPIDKQSFSLTILTNSDTGVSNIDRNVNVAAYSAPLSHPVKLNYYEENSNKNLTIACDMVQRQTPSSVKLHKSPEYKTSAEFSIDLCKRYKMETTNTNYNDINSQNSTEIKPNLQSTMSLNNVYMKAVQESPEDLSSWKKPSEETQNEILTRTVSSNNAGYLPIIPGYYAQPYLSPGNMIWKPINVMPIMSTGVQADTITSNQAGSFPLAQGQNVLRKNCNCNCHAPVPQLPMSFQGPVNPQYIITAVPFQNSVPKF